jgi:uncharacterized protein (DUF1330 family)
MPAYIVVLIDVHDPARCEAHRHAAATSYMILVEGVAP